MKRPLGSKRKTHLLVPWQWLGHGRTGTRILQELPADYPERPFYETLFKEMAERILSLQQEDGLWRASLLDPGSYPGGEVSSSGFCYAFAWGINNGFCWIEKHINQLWKNAGPH